MCTKLGQVVVDITASTSASTRACKASGRHFFGFEPDAKIFDALLKALCDLTEDDDGDKDDDDDDEEDLRRSKDEWNS